VTTKSNSSTGEQETGEHSVFQVHAFASGCWGCLVHTRCVRFIDTVDGRNADFCQPCYLAGEAEGYELGLFCEGCTEARAALGETK
jgi:hypothetical protein